MRTYKYLCKLRGLCFLDGTFLFWWVDETKWDDKLWGEQVVTCKGHWGKITLIAGITLLISSVCPCWGQGHNNSSLLCFKEMPSKKKVWLNEWQNIMPLFFLREHLRGSLKFAESVETLSQGQLNLSSAANATRSPSLIRNIKSACWLD